MVDLYGVNLPRLQPYFPQFTSLHSSGLVCATGGFLRGQEHGSEVAAFCLC